MKAITVALLLALCGLTTATTVFKRQEDDDVCYPGDAFIQQLISQCPAIVESFSTGNVASGVCTENCVGELCNHFKQNNFPSECTFYVAGLCRNATGTIPPGCGALALVTFKGVLAGVLLLTAVLIF